MLPQRSDVGKTRSDKVWDMSFHGKLSVQSCSRSCHDVGERNRCFTNWKTVTGTFSLLDDGPPRSTSVFCSLSLRLFFIVHICIWQQQDSTFLNALSADSVQLVRMITVRNRQQKVIVYAERVNEFCQLPGVKRKEKRTEHRSLRTPQGMGVSAERACPTRTCCDLRHDECDENQSRAEPFKPISAWSLWRSNVWSRVSKAAPRSSRSRRALFPPSIITSESLSMRRRAVAMLWLCLYADWNLTCKFFVSVNAISRFLDT